MRILHWVCWLSVAQSGWAQSSLADASLEELLRIQVTSASKKEQTLARTAASVYVMGAEEIRRSTAENLPDLLRMVPGVNVAQIEANAWAITIRGFNSRYSSKVLVMIDGRAVYTTTFGGVYWDQIDLPLETVERIEVIRGPGGTVWGANAVNGVINIITKNTRSTCGGLVSQSAGSEGAARGLVQYGGAAGKNADYRAFASWMRAASLDSPLGGEAGDGWTRLHSGFRGDWQAGARDVLMAEGGWFVNRGNQNRRSFFIDLPGSVVFNEPVRSDGGNLLARWSHTSESGAETSIQAYYDGYHRRDIGGTEESQAFDLDLQRHFTLGERHDLVVGGGYRTVRTNVGPGGPVTVTPSLRIDRLYSAFAQDEIRLGDRVWLTAGSKFEHNSYTGFEFEPSLRIAWTPGKRHTLWASAARAIRQPARADAGIQMEIATIPMTGGAETVITLSGNPGIRSEQLRDAEAGYRAQLSKTVSLDVSAFFSRYHGLLTEDARAPFLEVRQNLLRIVQPWCYGNDGSATDYGGEAMLGWTPAARLRLVGGYANLHMNGSVGSAADPAVHPPTVNNAPRHTLELRSFLNLTRRLEWDQFFSIQSHFAGGAQTRRHARVDTRLAWRAGEHVELSVLGQNLFRPGYVEFDDNSWIVGAVNERQVTGGIRWIF